MENELNINSLDEYLKRRYHKESRDEYAAWALEDPENLEAVWQRYCHGEEPVPRMAAWVLDKVCDLDHEALLPYLPELISMLPRLVTDGEKRTAMRILTYFTSYPEENSGYLLDVALEWLNNPLEAIAVRVHAMQVAFNISLSEPEIRRELATVIESHFENTSAGFKSRARKLLKKLNQKP